MITLPPRSRLVLMPVLLALPLLAAVPAQSADMQRGRLLYENHCVECHDGRAHYREGRRANSLAEVRQWVIRWSTTLTLQWNENERDDVAEYLYRRYYSPSTQ